MKKTHIYLALFGIIFGLISCYKDVPIKLEDYEHKIVVNGVFFNDTLIKINLSKTVDYGYSTDSTLPAIKNAKVDLYKDGEFVEQMTHLVDGFYQASIVAEAGHNYEVIVEAEDKIAKGTVVVPEKIETNGVKFIRYDENQYGNIVELNFIDPNDEKNYYLVDAYYYDSLYYWNDTGGYDSVGLYKSSASVWFQEDISTGGVVNSPYFSPYINGGVGFSDEILGEENSKLKLVLNTYTYTENITEEDSLTVYIRFYSINEDMFRFFISKEAYQNSIGNPLVEPVNVYSNIENGIGILGAFTFTLDSVRIPYKNYDY